jgi:hypothetical protein
MTLDQARKISFIFTIFAIVTLVAIFTFFGVCLVLFAFTLPEFTFWEKSWRVALGVMIVVFGDVPFPLLLWFRHRDRFPSRF